MEAKQIIEELYRSKDLKECLAKIRPVDIQQDVLQYVFTELLMKDDEMVIDLYRRNKLMAYVAKMLYNMVRWERGTFRKSLTKEVIVDTFVDIAYEESIDEIQVPLEKIYWYDAQILELYAKYGTYRAVAEITGINHVSIFHTVKKAKEAIKKHIEL